MDTVKNGKYTKRQISSLKGTTACQTADNVATLIESSGWPDPRTTSSGKQCLQYKRQVSYYKTNDGPTHHQKAIPPKVYRWWIRNAKHPREQARAQLLAGALFFAMRSCEYSKTKHKEQKTQPIRPCDIIFRIGAEIIHHNEPRIAIANNVEITFRVQRSSRRSDLTMAYKGQRTMSCTTLGMDNQQTTILPWIPRHLASIHLPQ
jgi:hypothetical protein